MRPLRSNGHVQKRRELDLKDIMLKETSGWAHIFLTKSRILIYLDVVIEKEGTGIPGSLDL